MRPLTVRAILYTLVYVSACLAARPASPALAQSAIGSGQRVEWTMSYGGRKADSFHAAAPTADGGVIAGGASESDDGDVGGNAGATDAWLAKIAPDGTAQTSVRFAGSGADSISSVVRTSDGGYVVAGVTESTDGYFAGIAAGGGRSAWVARLDPSFKTLWKSFIPGKANWEVLSISETPGGGFMLVGTGDAADVGWPCGGLGRVNLSVRIFSLDSSGTAVTSACHDLPDEMKILAATGTSDGGSAVVYNSGIFSAPNAIGLARFGADGRLLFDAQVPDPSGKLAFAIAQAPDGGFAVAGQYGKDDGEGDYPEGGDEDAEGESGFNSPWLARFSPDGKQLWESKFQGCRNCNFSTVTAAGGGFFAAGDVRHLEGIDIVRADLLAILTDADGKPIWRLQHAGKSLENAFAALVLSDGGPAVAGTTRPAGDRPIWPGRGAANRNDSGGIIVKFKPLEASGR